MHLLRYFTKISPRRAKARLRVIFVHASYLLRLFSKGFSVPPWMAVIPRSTKFACKLAVQKYTRTYIFERACKSRKCISSTSVSIVCETVSCNTYFECTASFSRKPSAMILIAMHLCRLSYDSHFCKYTEHLLRRTAKKCPQRILDTPVVLFCLSPCIYTVYLQKSISEAARMPLVLSSSDVLPNGKTRVFR